MFLIIKVKCLTTVIEMSQCFYTMTYTCIIGNLMLSNTKVKCLNTVTEMLYDRMRL